MAVPGAAYIQKILNFRDTHYERGELYMEYLKGDCSKTSSDQQPCVECKSSGWVGPPMSHIPRPWPDESKLTNYQYKGVFQSPNGKDADSRPTDDWQPRHNIKQMFLWKRN